MGKRLKKVNATEDVLLSKDCESTPELSLETPTKDEPIIETKKDSKKQVIETKTTTKQSKTRKTTSKIAIQNIKETDLFDTKLFIQYEGNEYETSILIEQAKEAWVKAGYPISSINSLSLYIKPEDHAAYYVINEQETGKISLL